MEFNNWLVFTSIGFVATMIPGPAVLVAMSQSAAYGWRHAIYAILGNISGLCIMSALSVLGLGAVILSSEVVFEVIKFVGAAYLIYLGIKLWRSGFNPSEVTQSAKSIPRKRRKAYLQGLAVALSNPKAIAFTTALFPQFVNHEENLLLQFSVLISTFMALSFSCLLGYAFLTERAKGRMFHGMSKVVSRLFGSAFIAAGLVLAKAIREHT
ncbi:threonine/homoserine/homoserine lactone efflux protein [Alteromonadaceae bacterium 2753L.S.0a.02]|nr:threonine/homoserine/homoserine lactone efflux protein [Alteromonadaceae bacterium 2753L.S.0a.02]